MEFYKRQLFNSNKDLIFLLKPIYILHINENDASFVPRFSLKETELFKDFPTNTPVKFDQALILKAIQWGMIVELDYKGDDDTVQQGHERTILPLVLGKNKNGQLLVRGYHLSGWSVSNGGNVEKEWRLFRADRILNMTFTGAFYRLAPDGYNATGDKSMTSILGQADFNQIRASQQKLLLQNSIDTIDRVILNKIKWVEAKDLNYNLKLFNPYANNVIPKKDAKNIRITFAKPVLGNDQWIAIIGISINTNNIFKLKVDNNELGSFKVVKWKMASELQNIKDINQQVEFKTYMFLKAQ